MLIRLGESTNHGFREADHRVAEEHYVAADDLGRRWDLEAMGREMADRRGGSFDPPKDQ